MKWLSAFVVAATIANSGCSVCGPGQHRITTASRTLTMGGGVATRQIQYVTYRLTQPPPSRNVMMQEVVWLVLALPVTLRQGDSYAVGSNFSTDVTDPAQPGFWGAHDLAQSNKADMAFVVSHYSFPPPVFTPNFTAVSSSGTIRVTNRTHGHVQLDLNLSFTDVAGNVRTVVGDAQANGEVRGWV